MLSSLIAVSVVGSLPALQPKMKLVWSDEFEVAGAPDPGKWTYEEGYVRNKEVQFYTRRPENVRVEGGKLVIEAKKDNWEGKPVTSASVTTRGLHSWQYGRFEIRAKIPTGRGTWPAIWMLGNNISQVGWPKSGEIDIMENVGYDPKKIHGTVHTGDLNHTKGTQKGGTTEHPDPWSDFHVYAVDWTKERMTFLFDGKPYFTFENDGQGDKGTWPFDQPFFLIINLAIGGGWGGVQGVDEGIYPSRYEIDWVRIYQ